MSKTRNRWHVCRLLASLVLLAVTVSPDIASGLPASAAPAAATSVSTVATVAAAATRRTVTRTAPPPGPASVTLASFTPAVARPGAPVTLSGTIRNTSAFQIDKPVVRALIGDRGLTSRGAVYGWAAVGEQAVAQAATTPLGPGLAPGAVAPFRLVIPAPAISHRDSFAVLPVSIEVIGATLDTAGQADVLGTLRTFLPALSLNKEYEPLSIAWLVPLSLDPDPALLGADGTARTAAWTKAIGPGSRLNGVITGTDSTKVTWAIDPALLGPPRLATATDSSTAGPTPTPSTAPAPGGATSTDPVTEATTTLANRLREAAPRHTLWALPYADPDLAALLPLASGQSALAALLDHPSGLAAAVGPARTGIAWPVDGALSTRREQTLRAAFSSSGLAGAVISASTRTMRSGYTDDASRKSVGGLPLLAYDQALSRTFAQTSAAASGAVTTQLFLADSLALLGERPGTPNRSALVAAPRTFAGNPTVLASFFAAVAQAPWLTPTSTEQLLAAAGTAAPDVPGSGPTVTPSPATPSPTTSPTSPATPDPLSAGRSALTPATLQNISRTTLAIDGVASIRDDTQSFRARWTDAQEQVLSSRWRGHAGAITVIDAATQAAITAVSSGVRVVPSSVNFFADRGVLQVTVVNDLAVPVHDVHLTLTPGQPRLRIDQQSGPLRIGAKSRTNVKLSVTAIAAGLVPVEAVLTTPNGTSLGQTARVNVRVQPTGTWLYWVLGGLAGIILLLGIYRSLLRGSTRSSRRAAPRIFPDE